MVGRQVGHTGATSGQDVGKTDRFFFFSFQAHRRAGAKGEPKRAGARPPVPPKGTIESSRARATHWSKRLQGDTTLMNYSLSPRPAPHGG